VFLKMLHKDMVFFDVGANMGWYSMLASVNGENITCHAFEPAPFIFQKLKNNAIINNVTDRVLLNNIAIGNSNTIVDLYTFKGLPHGHSSLSSQGRKEYSISTVKMTTLDSYISSNNISKVDFIKLDVEGAELNVVKGALSVFRHNPSWLIELNNHTASQFNYAPADILDAICKNGDYILYKIINGQDRLARLKHINDYGNGDNVFCIHRSNLQKLQVLDRLCK
jgi:FkbM family methyltransferase